MNVSPHTAEAIVAIVAGAYAAFVLVCAFACYWRAR